MQRNINGGRCTPRLVIKPDWNPTIDKKIQEEIHKTDEFEFYFGVKETLERLQEISINRELFFLFMKKKAII